MYGCNTAGDAALKLRERVFPLMMSKNASNKVDGLILIARVARSELQGCSTPPSFSSPLRAASSVSRRAKRERVGSQCGNLASETATPWRPASEAPLWVISGGCLTVVHVLFSMILCVFVPGDRKGTHFSTGDLKSIGYCICDTLLDFCDPDPSKVRGSELLAT